MSYIKNEFDRNQVSMLPISFDELISEDNPVRVIDAFVDASDLSQCKYANVKSVGRPAYRPQDMMKLYLYGYFNGIRSSRKLERECSRNIEVMWLLSNLKPDDKTICNFRKDNKKAIKSIFKQFSMLCNELNLIGKEIVAIDGSKFRASNARQNTYTKNKVAKMLRYYEESADKYLKLLEETEGAENEEVKVKLAHIQNKIKEIAQLEKAVEEKGSISVTDPDSKHMSVSNNGTDVSHNVQIAVDEKAHLVVALDVTSSPVDQGQLSLMSEKVKKELGVTELTVLADKGYYNGACLKHCQENGVKAIVSRQNAPSKTEDKPYNHEDFIYNEIENCFTCPMGHSMHCVSRQNAKRKLYKTKMCKNCEKKDLCTKNEHGKQITTNEYFEVYRKANALFDENKRFYHRRQELVEHPFGTIKRTLGYTYFLTCRHENVKNESYLHFLAYNVKRATNYLGVVQLLHGIQEKMPKIAQEASLNIALFGVLFNVLGENKRVKA